MAEKMTSIGLAIVASDFDDQRIRQPLAATSLAFALMGSARGENERQHYKGVVAEMIDRLNEQDAPFLKVVDSSEKPGSS